jgi:hypothetical protein
MAEASTISGSSSIATNPDPLEFCSPDVAVELLGALVVPSLEKVALVLVFVAGTAGELAALEALPSLDPAGMAPASAPCALRVTAPTTIDFNSWRIRCAPPKKSKNQKGAKPVKFSAFKH